VWPPAGSAHSSPFLKTGMAATWSCWSALATLETLIADQYVRARGLYRSTICRFGLPNWGLFFSCSSPSLFSIADGRLCGPIASTGSCSLSLFLDRDYVIGAVVLLITWPLALDLSNCLAAMQDAFSAQDREQG